ncbi:MAG: class I SAM-dependent methyltransferase [Christensenellales bacterium]
MNTGDPSYTAANAQAWDSWVEGGIEWGVPITSEEFARAKKGDWGVHLTPSKHVPREWFPDMLRTKVLCLAGGGGQQAPIFTALGAACTVLDNSARQLATEKEVAAREGYEIALVKGDMTRTLPFADGSFDLIFHPVSNCYVENVYHVWRECHRVLKRGGILLAGMDNGINFLFNDYDAMKVENRLPYNPLRDQALAARLTPDDGVQFSHTLEEQIGGQLRAGFRLTDIIDDYDRPGAGKLSEYTPLYIATRAVKR